MWNPPNRFLPTHLEWEEGEAPAAELEVFEDASRSILSHNDSPDLGFRWSVNPYRGCYHACAYCYARPSHELLGLGAGTDFERKIFVKANAPALLDAAFRKRSWRRERVVFSGVTDCYQPIEARWGLTRACLEVCERRANPAAIITKSALVERDLDVLVRLSDAAGVSVAISIPFLDESVARRMEPSSSGIARRFAAMRALAGAGLRVGIAVSPIIPGLNDADAARLLERAKECGASFAFHTMLRLPGSVRAVFLRRLLEGFPERAAAVTNRIRAMRGGELSESRFGRRHVGEGAHWDAIEGMWTMAMRRLGLGGVGEERPAPREESPPAAAQLKLPW